ncbi:MAG: class I SAM-dependent methyltransferase [Methanobacteriaceae archaeon]
MIRLVYDIKDYRELLKQIVRPEDSVVELGCHVGNSTKIISKLADKGCVVSLDNSPESVDRMESLMTKYSNVEFFKADVRLHETLEMVFKKVKNCDVLSIDLGGGYHPDTTFKVFFIWSSTLKPRDTLIRNRGLIDFVNSSTTVEDIRSIDGWLESSGNDGIPPRLKELKIWSSKL